MHITDVSDGITSECGRCGWPVPDMPDPGHHIDLEARGTGHGNIPRCCCGAPMTRYDGGWWRCPRRDR